MKDENKSGQTKTNQSSSGSPFMGLVMRHPLSDILDNMQDLDPEFSQVIDDNFWELI